MSAIAPLGIGVIGLGSAAAMMLPTLAAHPGVRIAAGADPRPDARARFATDFGAAVYETAEQLCAARVVDAVYIATPHRFHAPQAVAAAERGKHVIVEKPMALTLAECDAMIAAAERSGVQIVVGHTQAFAAPIRKIREIVRSGQLGPLAMINSWAFNNWLYRPRWPEELDPAVGGGVIFNQVPHQVDVVRTIGGGRVRSVRAMAWALDRGRPVEGSHATFLQFDNGAAATMVMSGYDYFDSDEFHAWVGEAGEEKSPDRHGSSRASLRRSGGAAETALKTARAYGGEAVSPWGGDLARRHHGHFGVTIVSCAHGDLRAAPDGVLLYGREGRVEIPVEPVRAFPDKFGVIDELIDAVAQGRSPLHNGRWGKATLEVCQAILTSARERREVMLKFQVGD